jgi:hypothetical protein
MTEDNFENPIAQLEELKRRYKQELKGFRRAKYGIMEEAMGAAVELRSNEPELKKFAVLAKANVKEMTTDNELITRAAVEFVIPGKLSWKAARVLNYLHDFKGVPIDELAEKLEELGGIEKLVRAAAREQPRRTKELVEPERATISALQRALPVKIPVISKVSFRKPKNSKKAPATSTISVSISSALLAKLKLVEIGRRIKLVGARQEDDDWTDPMLEVRKLILLKE